MPVYFGLGIIFVSGGGVSDVCGNEAIISCSYSLIVRYLLTGGFSSLYGCGDCVQQIQAAVELHHFSPLLCQEKFLPV